MKATTGDQILVDSERAGEPARTGEILEIMSATYGMRYRVRWDDGHESVIHPIGGSVHVRRRGDDLWQAPEDLH